MDYKKYYRACETKKEMKKFIGMKVTHCLAPKHLCTILNIGLSDEKKPLFILNIPPSKYTLNVILGFDSQSMYVLFRQGRSKKPIGVMRDGH